MIYINIPYVPENERIDKDFAKKEIQFLEISENAKQSAFEAIYNLKPRGVNFDGGELTEALKLEGLLSKLGIPYRRSEKSEY